MTIEQKVETQTPSRVITGRIESFLSNGWRLLFEREVNGSIYIATLSAEELRNGVIPTFSPIPDNLIDSYGFNWENGTCQLALRSKEKDPVSFHSQY
jgi:hypothetical protein